MFLKQSQQEKGKVSVFTVSGGANASCTVKMLEFQLSPDGDVSAHHIPRVYQVKMNEHNTTVPPIH